MLDALSAFNSCNKTGIKITKKKAGHSDVGLCKMELIINISFAKRTVIVH